MKNKIVLYSKHLTKILASSLLLLLVCTVQLTFSSIVDSKAADEKLREIHSKLSIKHGDFSLEYDEQKMNVMFLPKDAKVLEIGGNIGRVSCVTASILTHQDNLVTLESHPVYAKQLQENRDLNGLNFHIEASALSKVPLIQAGWNSMPSEVLLPGYIWVKTISFAELQKKYNIEFDTLVADCEGALYYILRDDPDILKNIKLILIENDFLEQEHLDFVHNLFRQNGFEAVYSQRCEWCRMFPSFEYFFQVWKR